MKKIFLMVFLVSMAAVVYSQTGIIRGITGEVELKYAGTNVFVRAQNGNQVAESTIISTGFRSTAIVEVGSSLITVQPLTRLTLSEIQSSSGMENLNVNLQAGRIRVEVNPPAGTRVSTTVQTPSATASVRGTTLIVDTNNLEVIKGTVNWTGSDNVNVSVSNGSSTINNTGGAQNPLSSQSDNLLPLPPAGSGLSGEMLSQNNSAFPLLYGDISVDISWW